MHQSIASSLDAVRLAAALIGAFALGGCSTVQVHDETRAKLAASGKKDYADAKVTEVIEADQKNNEFLLAAEITAVRENSALQVDYAALEIANNRTPMGDTYREAAARIGELGYASVPDLRASIFEESRAGLQQRAMDPILAVFAKANVTPVCDPGKTFDQQPLPTTLTPGLRRTLQAIYPEYLKRCVAQKPPIPGGLIGRAYTEWENAKGDAADANISSREADARLKAAQDEYDARTKQIDDAKKKGEQITKELTEGADKAAKALAQAKKLATRAELETQIDALVQILTAVAGGDINTQDPDLKRAADIAKQIPTIADDIAQMEATRTAPPVSGLLLALRHKTLLADAARKRAQLEDERVAILKVKYDAYRNEARRWLAFHDAMCNYAALAARNKYPGTQTNVSPDVACNKFKGLEADGTCNVEGTISKCPAGNSWRDALRESGDPRAKREVYRAVANYLQATALGGVRFEQDFRELDVRQRETLLAKRSALETWDNLVTVPVEQLDGYYQGGVKPAEIAELILRALTFTAIAVGVSK